MSDCPQCGIQRSSEDRPCMICGYMGPKDVEDTHDMAAELKTIRESVDSCVAELSTKRTQKSRSTYIVLGLFLGFLGVHNFYADRNGPAVGQLLIFVFLVWMCGIGGMISFVWALLDILSVRVDGKGLEMA